MDRRRLALFLSLLGALVVLSIPLFFDIFRNAAFQTAPRDDYAPYLQSLIGQGGKVPGAPMIYRLFSVAVAIPFYFVLPLYSFSQLGAVDIAYLRATEALAAVSWLSIIATAVVMFVTCQRKLRASIGASLVVALLSFAFAGFISETGVDPINVLIFSVLLYVIDSPLRFSALLLLSVGFNEKIAFVCL